MASVSWISPPAPRSWFEQDVEDLGLQDVAARDDVVRGRGAGAGLLDHAGDLEGLAEFLAAETMPYWCVWSVRHLLDRDDVAAVPLVGRDHLLHGAAAQHVGQEHREGLVADDLAGAPDRVAEAERRLLAGEARLAGGRQVPARASSSLVLPRLAASG